MKRQKSFFILLLIIPALTGTAIHDTGRMWPLLPVGFLLFGLVYIAALIKTEFSWSASVGGLLGGVLLIVHAVLLPSSFTGRDPSWFFIAAQKIVETGSTDMIYVGFYESISGFPIYLSELILIFDDPSRVPIILAIMVLISLPLAVGYFAQVISPGRVSVTLGIFFAVVGQSSFKFAMVPIAQTLHVVTIAISAGLVVKYDRQSDLRYGFLLLIFLIFWSSIHKLPLVMLLGSLVGIVGLRLVFQTVQSNRKLVWDDLPINLIAIVATLIAVQQTILTGYVVSRAVTVFTVAQDFGFVTSVAGDVPDLGVLSVFSTVSNVRVLVIGASLASIVLFHRLRSRRTLSALGFVGGAIGIAVVAAIAWVPVTRVLGSLTPLLITVIAGALSYFYSGNLSMKSAATGFIIILIITQAFTAGLVLDDPRTPRRYLDEEEAGSKMWIESFVTDHVYADSQYVLSILPGRLSDVTIMSKTSLRHGEYGLFRVPRTTDDLQNEPVVKRDISLYFYGWIHQFYEEKPMFVNDRNVIYDSGSVSVSSPP
ncbi:MULTISPECIES: hypothetical protein [unclassified Haloferax]|uniref:hypothetical protein n=1 Tax=unclassified Haloferax TaxID=2625095 RepID=UPI000A7EB1F6|nr:MULTISPECIES: hypothetical protein [unclassified Haloferax]